MLFKEGGILSDLDEYTDSSYRGIMKEHGG